MQCNRRVWQKSRSFVHRPEPRSPEICNNIVRSTTFPSEVIKGQPRNEYEETRFGFTKRQRKLPARPESLRIPKKSQNYPNTDLKSLRETALRNEFPSKKIYERSSAHYPSKNITKSYSYSDHYLNDSLNYFEGSNNVVNSRTFAGRFLPEETESWFSNEDKSGGLGGYSKNRHYQSILCPELDKSSNTSGSIDYWFETNSDYGSERNIFDRYEAEESDEERYFTESRKFFEKSTETFLNNSLTNIKNNNLPFADMESKNLFGKNHYDNFYDKMEDRFDFYSDRNNKNVYSYHINNDTNNNDKVKITKLSIPSWKRPLGIGPPKPDIKHFNNNRNYFFTNKLLNDNLYMNSYNNKNTFYNFLFNKGKNTNSNKNYQVTSLTRPLCFSHNR